MFGCQHRPDLLSGSIQTGILIVDLCKHLIHFDDMTSLCSDHVLLTGIILSSIFSIVICQESKITMSLAFLMIFIFQKLYKTH